MSLQESRVTEESPLSPLVESSGNESAEQQLFIESQLSTSKPAIPPTSAVRSANLLNAARIDKRRTISGPIRWSSPSQTSHTTRVASSPVGKPRRADGAGKLKRPSFQRGDLAIHSRRNAAVRGDIYELQLSPERPTRESPPESPETANRKSLKKGKKGKKQGRPKIIAETSLAPQRSTTVLDEESLFIPESEELPTIPSSTLESHGMHDADHNQRKSRRLAEVRPQPQRRLKRKAGEQHPDRSRPSKSPRRENINIAGPVSTNALANGDANTRSRGAHRKPRVIIPASTRGRPRRGRRTHANEQLAKEYHSGLQKDDENAESEVEENLVDDTDYKDPDNGDVGLDHEGSDALDHVFEFLNFERRRGKCQTNEAENISIASRQARDRTRQGELTLKEVFDTSVAIRALLAGYGRNEGGNENIEDLRSLKIDAYGYLFRCLIEYLKELHSWLANKFEDLTHSAEAMRVLSLFVQDIVSFKDTITFWKVSLPSRYKNDRFIKVVDSDLIPPLRKVDETYRSTLSRLEASMHAKRKGQTLIQKMREKEEERRRKDHESAIYKQRWERWQVLHERRLGCEPDNQRRRHSFIKRRLFDTILGNSDECDANGLIFERVPLFKDRLSLPRRASFIADVKWTDEQEGALIDGLKEFDGADVFGKIFEKYCPPGGVLRDFNVLEITAKAVSIRSNLINLYQSKDWPLDEWIEKIPVLP